jgi:hypothetical protein
MPLYAIIIIIIIIIMWKNFWSEVNNKW